MKNVRRSVILILLKKETGENPVRARRREVQKRFPSCLMPQIRDKPLDKTEKVKEMYRVEISA